MSLHVCLSLSRRRGQKTLSSLPSTSCSVCSPVPTNWSRNVETSCWTMTTVRSVQRGWRTSACRRSCRRRGITMKHWTPSCWMSCPSFTARPKICSPAVWGASPKPREISFHSRWVNSHHYCRWGHCFIIIYIIHNSVMFSAFLILLNILLFV